MGGVIIESFNAQVGGSALASSVLWEDNFGGTPGRGINEITRDYYHVLQCGIANTQVAIPAVGVNSGLRFTEGNSTGNPCHGHWVPIRLSGVQNRSQFSQAILLADSGAGTARGGLSTMVWGDQRENGNSASYMALLARDTAAGMSVQRNIDGTSASLGNVNNIPAIGTVITFTADLESSPGNVLLTVLYNGVSVFSVLDNTVPQLFGMPGLVTRPSATVNGVVFELGSFRAGLLSLL